MQIASAELTFVFVKQFGPEVVKEVRRLLRRFCLRQTACVNLFLNLEDPGTYRLTAEFEQLFFV